MCDLCLPCNRFLRDILLIFDLLKISGFLALVMIYKNRAIYNLYGVVYGVEDSGASSLSSENHNYSYSIISDSENDVVSY